MRRMALVGLIAGLGGAHAAVAVDFSLVARETRYMNQPGATAAFAVDPSVVEVSIRDGMLVLEARHAGETLISVVHAEGVETHTVVVSPSPSQIPTVTSRRRVNTGHVAVSYDSGLDRHGLDASLDVVGAKRDVRMRLHAIHEGDSSLQRGVAVPHASIEVSEGERRLTLLDAYVEGSPLTFDGTVVRGIHASNGTTELHAGIASTQPWEDALLPSHGDRAAGVAWTLPRGSLTFLPSLLWLPDARTDVPGVAALGVRRGGADDALQLGAELGWSGAPGVAIDLAWRQPSRQVWLRGAYRPEEFAALDQARPAGSYLDGLWSEYFGVATQATVTVSANRLDLAERDPEAITAHLDVRHALDARWSVSAGLGGGEYREQGGTSSSRRTASVGVAYETQAVRVNAQYRHQEASGFDAAGRGGRVGVRAQGEGWRANAYFDAQENAPGLVLNVPPGSDLARALAELGVGAGSPEDILRLVRDHAALFARYGVHLGDLRLDPLRLQAGLDLSWQPGADARTRLGMRLQAHETRGLADRYRTSIATVFAAWKILEDLDLEVGFTRWSTRATGLPEDDQNSLQIMLRKTFDDFALPGQGRRSIRGAVLLDASAEQDAKATPIAFAQVVLDGHRRVHTDADGRFEFEAPGPGAHHVMVLLPAGTAGYFSGPSSRTLRAGDDVRFSVLPAPARVTGRVLSDAGVPLAGVSVRLAGAAPGTTSTDSSGAFRFATAPGDVQISLVPESIPAGYDLTGVTTRREQLAIDAPATVDFVLHAQRSIRGIVEGAHGGATIAAPALDKRIETDAEGRFILRGLPPGPLTLVVRRGTDESTHSVTLPDEPGRVEDLVLPVRDAAAARPGDAPPAAQAAPR